MREVSDQILIEAPVPAVWATIADLASAQSYLPGVRKSFYISEVRTGVGASRHCDIQTGLVKGFLKERVIDWTEGESYVIELYEWRGVPYKSMTAEFRVAPSGASTLYTQTMRFELKGGPLAPLFELIGARLMRKLLRRMVSGLKRFVEGESGGFVRVGRKQAAR